MVKRVNFASCILPQLKIIQALVLKTMRCLHPTPYAVEKHTR